MGIRIPASFAITGMELALRAGLDLSRLLVDSGLSPMDTHPYDFRVSEEQAIRLLDWLRKTTDDDLLGLGRAPVPRGTIRLLSYAMSSVTTLHEGVERFSGLSRSIPGLPTIDLDVRDDQARLSFGALPENGANDNIIVVLLTVVIRIIGWAINEPVPIVAIDFPFAKPANSDDISLILGKDVHYDVAQSPAIVLPAATLARPIVHDEKAILDYIARAPGAWLSPVPDAVSLTDRVTTLIERHVERQHLPSADELAHELLISTPTLRRRLQAEATSVREIRDSVMSAAAIVALRDTNESITAVATRLGFSETSAFTRAFRRWTGQSPVHYRTTLATPTTS